MIIDKFSLIVKYGVKVGCSYNFVLYRCQKVHIFVFSVDCDDLLIEVRLDARVQLQVDVRVLTWQLETHHNFPALMEPQLTDFWRFLSYCSPILLHQVFVAAVDVWPVLAQPVDHILKSRRFVWLQLSER